MGVHWEWNDLGPDECVLSSDFKKYGVEKGMRVTFAANYMDVFKTIANLWNSYRVERPELPYVSPEIFFWDDRADIYCTVRGFSSDGSGKFPSDGWKHMMVINDFYNYIPRIWNATTFSNADLIPQEFADYVVSSKDLSGAMANSFVA